MDWEKEFAKRYRIRQGICVILGICIAWLLLVILWQRGMMRVDAMMTKTQQSLAEEVFRFHVLANSDSKEDQAVKLKVRDAVIAYMKQSMAQESDEEMDAKATKEWAKDHLKDLENAADQILKKEGYDYTAKASVESCYFPDKRYGDILFPQGNYEALRIKLGEAKGQNWWCVLYPNLCFTGATCAVVSEEGKEELKEALTAEEYEMVTAMSDFKIRWFFFGDVTKEE